MILIQPWLMGPKGYQGLSKTHEKISGFIQTVWVRWFNEWGLAFEFLSSKGHTANKKGCSLLLKVSKVQIEFMKSSFLQRYEWKIVRISALCSEAHYRAEIRTIFRSYFGRNDDSMNSFWNLLTFRIVRFIRQMFVRWNKMVDLLFSL